MYDRMYDTSAAEGHPTLTDAQVCTIPLLLKIAPPGTVDPTPLLYDGVFYTIAGAATIALGCNIAAFRMARPRTSKR